jgi:hypothetical protein
MTHSQVSRTVGRVIPLLLPLLVGCGGSGATVSGTITYDGALVEQGFITFFPVDDAGATQGAAIVQGKYRVAGLSPGKKRVLITTAPEARKVPAGGSLEVQLRPGKDAVPRNAVGNNQVLEVATGEQTLDFRLARPKR